MEASGPKRAGAVLATLILVAGVANLNLAVANVALPDIGKAFGAGQTMIDLIAVGYSLGLAASVLYLGAVGDRYGRKTLLLLGMALTIPISIFAALAPSAAGPVPRPRRRRRRRRHGLPDHPGADHGALAGAGADQTDRALVGARRRRLGARAAARRRPAGRVRVGLGLHHQRPAGGDRPRLRLETGPGPRQRDDRAGRPPRRHPLDRPGRDPGAGDQPGAGTGQGRDRDHPRRRRPAHHRRLHPAPEARRQPALRPQDRRPQHLLGRRPGRDHRLRLADGGDVHRPAVRPERARLLDPARPAWRSSPAPSG